MKFNGCYRNIMKFNTKLAGALYVKSGRASEFAFSRGLQERKNEFGACKNEFAFGPDIENAIGGWLSFILSRVDKGLSFFISSLRVFSLSSFGLPSRPLGGHLLSTSSSFSTTSLHCQYSGDARPRIVTTPHTVYLVLVLLISIAN